MFDGTWQKVCAGILGILLIVIASIGIAKLVIWEEEQWQAYKATHNCKQIDYIPSRRYISHYDNKGNPVWQYESARTIYKCDNEEIRER